MNDITGKTFTLSLKNFTLKVIDDVKCSDICISSDLKALKKIYLMFN